ncbi:regulator of nucleoside diphosphate kinase [Maribacter sedimenticola]|uniref:Regulator of nucleoside diphosphate kinase n=1 Tax=Maribacter sedimenticola TaxID=228956 RepID=A0ABY1SDX9_9FLAO|nr:GreA/GreB family elongation factor [Maribacter sedimenticola]SNR28218.1 regulator of nucleoside diphosphate kinase [Maribacter sedimenticola]
MKYGSLVLEKKDFVMIQRYQQLTPYVEDYAHKDALDNLKERMATALIYDLEDMPEDIIRMYSYVNLSYESGWNQTFQLVPPHENNLENDKISVQSTLGASIIGLSEGDIITYGLPSNVKTLTIKKITQSNQHFKVNITERTINEALAKHKINLLTQNSEL